MDDPPAGDPGQEFVAVTGAPSGALRQSSGPCPMRCCGRPSSSKRLTAGDPITIIGAADLRRAGTPAREAALPDGGIRAITDLHLFHI